MNFSVYVNEISNVWIGNEMAYNNKIRKKKNLINYTQHAVKSTSATMICLRAENWSYKMQEILTVSLHHIIFKLIFKWEKSKEKRIAFGTFIPTSKNELYLIFFYKTA